MKTSWVEMNTKSDAILLMDAQTASEAFMPRAERRRTSIVSCKIRHRAVSILRGYSRIREYRRG